MRVFNAAMGESRKAAEYYRLDGFVTEHVQLLQDCAELYKHLAVYEQDPHRKVCERSCWLGTVQAERTAFGAEGYGAIG